MALCKRNARRFPSPLPHFPAKGTPQRTEVLLPPLPSKSDGKAEKYSDQMSSLEGGFPDNVEVSGR